MSEDLYILPPSLKPYEPVDGSNTRYLNQYHISIVNPLKCYYTLNHIMKIGSTHHLKHSLHHSSMIVLPYSFLQMLQLPSLGFQTL